MRVVNVTKAIIDNLPVLTLNPDGSIHSVVGAQTYKAAQILLSIRTEFKKSYIQKDGR